MNSFLLMNSMTDEQHKLRHETLHRMLDELVADYIDQHPGKRLSDLTVIELIEWSYTQTKTPTKKG